MGQVFLSCYSYPGVNQEVRKMEQTMKVFMDYAAAFEQTYIDDDWSRLAPFFSEDATYEVRGGPLACEISGRESIFSGLKKSIDGMDRRCDERQIDLMYDHPTPAKKCNSSPGIVGRSKQL
jgi:hypothetical protein